MTLYCPKCGAQLIRDESGYLECRRGEMQLAQELERRLLECYVTQVRHPREGPFTYAGKSHPIGGTWFCPGCGVAVTEQSPGDLRCPKCTLSLVEFVYSLIEKHPHKSEGGGWR